MRENKNIYESPEIEVVLLFENGVYTDVITTSDYGSDDSPKLPGNW